MAVYRDKNRLGNISFIAITLLCVVGFAYFKMPLSHSGNVQVIDGDSLRLNAVEVRLLGIDAPEFSQTCRFKGQEVRCGRDASRHLAGIVNGRNAVCHEKEKDQYNRALSRCYIGDLDLGQQMVRDGFAVSFNDYIKEESEARLAKKGIWAMEFERPKDYRTRKRAMQ